MKTSGQFIHITLHCIAVAMATGLVTAIMLIAVVLLFNSGTTAAGAYDKSWSCSNGKTRCIVLQRNTSTLDVAGL